MNAAPDPSWEPDPQLLAAYFDGELEGRDDLAEKRLRVEVWLEAHPEAVTECAELRAMQKLWLDTTPAEPSSAAWQQCLAGINVRRTQLSVRAPSRRPWFAYGAVAAGLVFVIGTMFGAWRLMQGNGDHRTPIVVVPKHEEIEVFEVARANEVTILRVEGADTEALVVGLLPLVGLLELADPGDVDVLNMCPDARDQMLPNVRDRGRPLIWARVDVD